MNNQDLNENRIEIMQPLIYRNRLAIKDWEHRLWTFHMHGESVDPRDARGQIEGRNRARGVERLRVVAHRLRNRAQKRQSSYNVVPLRSGRRHRSTTMVHRKAS